MTLEKISLVKDTIDFSDIKKLISWLETNPRLTKGKLTTEFEKKWSEWLGVKYSVFVNSGSSANLAAIYSLLLSGKLKNNKIVVPAVSWVTTVTPAIQLGMEPIMCECDIDNLGLDINHLKKIIKNDDPSVIILVHVLGFPNYMDEIIQLCKENNILLIEDTCESMGSKYNDKLLGTLGDLSTFSFYFGHHMSTIEGGMVSTDNEDLYHILLSIRSHGWDRDLPEEKQEYLRKKYNVDNFRSLYTFYYPGFNLRATDLQAFIGLGQLEKLDTIVTNRNKNYERYKNEIKNNFWNISPPKNSFISNFSFPIITKNIKFLTEELIKNNIECRPLICGSINEHPFWYERYGKQNLPNSKLVHEFGLYIPNNHQMTDDEISKVINIVNKHI
ncbi:lipopolysaccharide biosynthesis protein RfbH [uncultured Caudovirales phage]|uniref:Lipopolysaccharide biosynthesis protein RfbH n=1 Tax=uncultured Caudovirales phage TaxID=2100421 RepID=A0A6J5LAA6_9CAUD|nr:lipopolysaccharide biosynthesis protein RfbH [uncultured Caudovirales phage]